MMMPIEEKKKWFLHTTPPNLIRTTNDRLICAFSYYQEQEGPSIGFYDFES